MFATVGRGYDENGSPRRGRTLAKVDPAGSDASSARAEVSSAEPETPGDASPDGRQPGREATDPGPDVALSEPARQRLVTLASDVVGRLPVEQLPAALRPFARFTPAKRARLGATVLSGTLDADAGFRAEVADVVAATSPELAEAVRTGGSTAAADPVDVAVVAYLIRADGWQKTVAAANQRWAAERQQHGAAAVSVETKRLRAEVAELRGRLRAESAAAKTAAIEAADRTAAELAELRRQLRARTAEVKSAEQTREEALGAAADAEARAAAAETARDAELRRARNRMAELEQAAEAARRGARRERDMDDARLWLLVDTLTEAAAGIRRELSLTAPTVRPADTVDAAVPVTAVRRADNPTLLDRVLSTPNLHLIVDGYNVTKSGFAETSLAEQRSRLITAMAALAGRCGAETTIVFDGGQRPPIQAPTPRGIRVLFSAVDEIADDLIRRLVAAEPVGRPVLVVTSDRQLALDVAGRGAWTAPAAALLGLIS
jgi:predicted RNA-binding protein with PIN domain